MARRSPSQYNWSKLRFDETILRKHFTSQSSKNVRFIVVHHSTIIGNGSGSALTAMYNVWQNRPASAHYGVDGRLVRQYVWDKDYAWATGSTVGNRDGISIEHMNSTGGPGWRVAATTWKTGARLAAQLHYYYGLGIPVAGKTLRKHSSFTSTACPGPYLGGRIWKKYVKEARRVYKKIAKGQPIGAPAPRKKDIMPEYKVQPTSRSKPQILPANRWQWVQLSDKGNITFLSKHGYVDVTAFLKASGLQPGEELFVRFVRSQWSNGRATESVYQWPQEAVGTAGNTYSMVSDKIGLDSNSRLRVQVKSPRAGVKLHHVVFKTFLWQK